MDVNVPVCTYLPFEWAPFLSDCTVHPVVQLEMEELLLAPRTGGLQLAEEFFTTLRKYELRQVCVQRASEASEPKSRPLCMHSTYRRAP